MNSSDSRFPRRALFLLILAEGILRIGTNLSRVDEYLGEGLYRGSLAQSWVVGAPLWPRHWAEIPHVPGSILIGVVAMPFYWAFGPSTFSLHCAGIVFHAVGLVAWMLLLHRRFGRTCSILGGALYVFAPPSIARMAIVSYGDHLESLPFFLFAALFHLDWFDPNGRRGLRTPFLAGFTLTLAISFHLQAALAVGALGVTCALLVVPSLRERRFWRDLLLAYVPGAIAGALPGLWVFYYSGTSALTLWGGSPTEHVSLSAGTSKFLEKWLSFVKEGASLSFQWNDRRIADAMLLGAMGCALALGIAALRSWKKGETSLRALWLRAGFFVVYPLAFSMAYGASSKNFTIEGGTSNALEVRYALPILPFLLLPVAVAAARLFDAGRRAAAAGVAVPYLVLGLVGSLSTWDFPSILHEPARRGYLWEEFDTHWAFGSMDEEFQESTHSRFRFRARESHLDGMIEAFVSTKADPARFLQFVKRYDSTEDWTWPLRYVPPRLPLGMPPTDPKWVTAWTRERPVFAHYRCVAAGEAAARLTPFNPAVAGSILLSSPEPDLRQVLARGFGRGMLAFTLDGHPPAVRFFDGVKAAERVRSLPRDVDRFEIAFGFGFRVGSLATEFYPAGDLLIARFVKAFPAEHGAPFARGLGAGYRQRFLEPPTPLTRSPGADRLEALLPPSLSSDFRAGFHGAP